MLFVSRSYNRQRISATRTNISYFNVFVQKHLSKILLNLFLFNVNSNMTKKWHKYFYWNRSKLLHVPVFRASCLSCNSKRVLETQFKTHTDTQGLNVNWWFVLSVCRFTTHYVFIVWLVIYSIWNSEWLNWKEHFIPICNIKINLYWL